MTSKLIAAAAFALFLGTAHAQEPAVEGSAEPKSSDEVKPVDEPRPTQPRHHRGPGKLIRGGMAMKAVVCKVVEEGKGKSGQDLANAIEALATQFGQANYRLSAILQGDPPIACFYSLSDSSKLPMGAR